MKLVVAIPALNEAATVGRVIREARVALRDTPHEVVVVDDGSTDTTVSEARAAGAVVVLHGINRGVGVAFQTGVREALARGADILVHLDADGQFNPADIPALLAPVLDGSADIAICSRFLKDEFRPAMPAVHTVPAPVTVLDPALAVTVPVEYGATVWITLSRLR